MSEYKKIILNIIKEISEDFSDLRIGQLLYNFLSWHQATYCQDVFYIEDNLLMLRLEKFKKHLKGE